MNKAVITGGIIAVIIGIIIISVTGTMKSSDVQPIVEDNEVVPIPENEVENPTGGRNLSVELSETMVLTSP
ncbi:MAG TPA: hypothetical protein VLE02_05305 [Nitrosarchaeum sp.]|nr:hypothetical protein [Nitrosarchaeum sp.]